MGPLPDSCESIRIRQISAHDLKIGRRKKVPVFDTHVHKGFYDSISILESCHYLKNRVRTLHSIVTTDEELSCYSQLENPCAHDSNFSYWHFPLSEIHEH